MYLDRLSIAYALYCCLQVLQCDGCHSVVNHHCRAVNTSIKIQSKGTNSHNKGGGLFLYVLYLVRNAMSVKSTKLISCQLIDF